jgi:ubiquinone/menaquinone biosynthesis C-methylase UbiE
VKFLILSAPLFITSEQRKKQDKMFNSILKNVTGGADHTRALGNYRDLAPGYDATCARIEQLRFQAIDALDLCAGEVVHDICCGTGVVLPILAEKVGRAGRVVGVELSPEMATQARDRITRSGLTNVEVVNGALEAFSHAEKADAFFLSYTHDVLQCDDAITSLIAAAKPNARVVILGMKTLPWLWGWPINVFNLYRARQYLTTYSGMDKPWRKISAQGARLRVTHTALIGSAYIASGNLK